MNYGKCFVLGGIPCRATLVPVHKTKSFVLFPSCFNLHRTSQDFSLLSGPQDLHIEKLVAQIIFMPLLFISQLEVKIGLWSLGPSAKIALPPKIISRHFILPIALNGGKRPFYPAEA
jgi:hypothetical protein